jgi:tRNA (cmo5U34)-methyltransferase
MESLEKMSAFFNNRAEIYDEKHVEHIGGGLESKGIIASLLPDNTMTIIDLGIGTGLELEAIFNRFPDIEVVGLDIAEKMLQQLNIKYAGKRIKLHNASYLDFDFGCDLYDAALSVMTLHHYSHEAKVELYHRLNKCL